MQACAEQALGAPGTEGHRPYIGICFGEQGSTPLICWHLLSMHIHLYSAGICSLCIYTSTLLASALYAYTPLLCWYLLSMHIHLYSAGICSLCTCTSTLLLSDLYAHAPLLCWHLISMHMHLYSAGI